MEYSKVKSVAKAIQTRGLKLDKTIANTMRLISDIVGSTLGPGGQQVLIERSEHGLPPMVTKDGVTVFRSLGFRDGTMHCIMETARDCAVRTGQEAGDGTTTATILAQAIVENIQAYCKENPTVSPQRLVRELEKTFRDVIAPQIKSMSVKASLADNRQLLTSVATISANGDVDLAEAVLRCFDKSGDEGNITISESSGPSHYEEEEIDGYPIPMGYEESCAKFYAQFINDTGRQMTALENPVFILYHGVVPDIQTCKMLLETIGEEYGTNKYNHNIVFVANGFAESVLATLGINFKDPRTINVFPLLVPKSPLFNGQLQFLDDLSAITGAKVLDPLNNPLDCAILDDLGPGVESFEASRFRSIIVGHANEDLILDQVSVIQEQLKAAASELDVILTRERLAKLTGGIVKLKVFGASNGELKEKRDRADDAVCAVRGAIKHGCLPGGGWALLAILAKLDQTSLVYPILSKALAKPITRLAFNLGVTEKDELEEIMGPVRNGIDNGKTIVYDFLQMKHVEAFETGILDSTPAVLEALRNSISIASLLGTLGGTVVQERDYELEQSEARATADFLRNSGENPADERV